MDLVWHQPQGVLTGPLRMPCWVWLSASLIQTALALVGIALGQAFDKTLGGCFDKSGEFAWEHYSPVAAGGLYPGPSTFEDEGLVEHKIEWCRDASSVLQKVSRHKISSLLY